MNLTRRFWLAAVGTLALLLAASSAQAQGTKLLPNDTEMIVTINIQQILKSEVVKSNKTLLDLAKQKIEEKLDDNGAGKYLKKAGFDLFKDLSSITVAIPGTRDAGEGFMLLEGKFDAEKIEEAATEAAKEAGEGTLKIIEIANTKAYQITAKDDEKTIYVGVLNKKTMIACTAKKDFAEAVARLSGSRQAAFKAEVNALLETVNKKQSISIIATSAALAKVAEKAPEGAGDKVKQAAAVLKQVEGISASITIAKDIDFQVGINAKDNKTATDYANMSNLVVGGFKAKLAEQAKQNEKIAPALDVINTVRAAASGNNLLISGKISFETLEKILQSLPGN